MIENNKNLLLKDLSSRLPYGVKVYDIKSSINSSFMNLNHVNGVGEVFISYKLECRTALIEDVKPYLFPLSSMTEEQWDNAPRVNLTNFTFESFKCGCFTLASYTCENNLHDLLEVINWLYANHFDVNGLIPLGLAIDATGLNIY